LVRLQLEVAAGEKLLLRQEDIAWRGAAIECRIYAEDPYNNFVPSPGKITRLARPLGPGVRLDGCVYEGWTVPIDYDPLLAKLAVWNGTRETAIARMLRALREYDVGGIHTNIAFFRQILDDEEFRAGRLHTHFLDEFMERRKPFAPPPELESIAAMVAAFHSKRNAPRAETAPPQRSRWLEIGRHEALR
jgi:acetyl-CoA carboxylase biotin carboxylase subunit